MKFDQFMELGPEMKVQIVRKCYAIPYIRLRQTCRFMNEFCEENRKRLGIYCYRKRPSLFLLNTLNILPFKRNKEVRELDGVYVALNYGQRNGDTNFLVQMTAKNISQIRSSLSGFAFTSISLINISVEDYEENKKFSQALIFFLEATVDITVKHLIMKNLTTAQVRLVTSTWTAEKIDVQDPRNMKEVVEMDTVKKVECVSYSFLKRDTTVDKYLLEEAVKGKNIVCLFLGRLPIPIASSPLYSTAERWQKKPDPFAFFLFFERAPTFYESNIMESYGPLVPKKAAYVGSYRKFMRAVQSPVTDFLSREDKWDIWIRKFNNNNKDWQLFSIRRVPWRFCTNVDFHLKTSAKKKYLTLSLIDLLNDIFPGNAMDYSDFADQMKAVITAEEARAVFNTMAQFMRQFYTRVYRKQLLNLMHEMVTEGWNGPRWILEFTRRKPIEPRRPIIDLGYVLFQEVLCPIYQYCSVA